MASAAQDIDQLAQRAEAAGNTQLRELAKRLLDVANAGAQTESQLGKVRDELAAVESVNAGVPFPLSKPDEIAPEKGSASAGSRGSRGGLSEYELAQLVGARLAAFETDLQAEIDATRDRIIKLNQWNQRELQGQNTLRLQAERESMAELPAFEKEEAARKERERPIYEPIEGARAKFKELADDSKEYGRLIGDSIQLAADTGAKALSAFVLEGKSGLKDLAKTAADQLMTGAFSFLINALIGNTGNALLNSFTPAQTSLVTPGNTGSNSLTYGGPRAAGGAVRNDRWYWVGENGPERFVPHAAGNIAPAGQGGLQVVNQVIDQRQAGSPPVEQSQSRGPNGEVILRTIIRDEVPKMVASGGLDSVFRSRFGQRPAPRR